MKLKAFKHFMREGRKISKVTNFEQTGKFTSGKTKSTYMTSPAAGSKLALGSSGFPTDHRNWPEGANSCIPSLISAESGEYVERFQALFELAPAMIWMFGADAQCRFFNQAWLDFRGRTLEQERGSKWIQGIHPEDRRRCLASFYSAFEARQPMRLDFRLQGADGSYSWMTGHAVPQYLLNGTFVGYVGSIGELQGQSGALDCEAGSGSTVRPSMRETLCEISAKLGPARLTPMAARASGSGKRDGPLSQEALRRCLDISLTPMVVLDEQGNSLYCNEAFRAFATAALSKAGPQEMWTDCASSEQAWLDSSAALEPGGIKVRAQPLFSGGRQCTAFSFIDTSQSTQSRLLARAFLHDLANSAGAIQTLAHLLSEETSRKERAEYVKLLQISITRLLSEIEHERKWLERAPRKSDVSTARELLDELMQSYPRQLFDRKCRIEVVGGALDSMQVLADRSLIVRVLDNMLRNAVEATVQGGYVKLGCRRVEDKLEFWVHNDGAISPRVRERIFRSAISTKGRGRGLGTQAIKLVSELYLGGTVTVSSDEENGTTFSVRFPASSEVAAPPSQELRHIRNAS